MKILQPVGLGPRTSGNAGVVGVSTGSLSCVPASKYASAQGQPPSWLTWKSSKSGCSAKNSFAASKSASFSCFLMLFGVLVYENDPFLDVFRLDVAALLCEDLGRGLAPSPRLKDVR